MAITQHKVFTTIARATGVGGLFHRTLFYVHPNYDYSISLYVTRRHGFLMWFEINIL